MAHTVWECSTNLFSKSLPYRSAPKQNSLFVNQFFGILIYSGKFINWAYDFQSIGRWILCPLMPDEKLIWMKWKSSSASRITDEIVALISPMLFEYPANTSYKHLRAQAYRKKEIFLLNSIGMLFNQWRKARWGIITGTNIQAWKCWILVLCPGRSDITQTKILKCLLSWFQYESIMNRN